MKPLGNNAGTNIGVKIVLFFDLIVSIIVGIKFIPTNIHIFFRVLIIISIFFISVLIMNIKKFGLGLIAIIAVSVLFSWVMNGLIISPYNVSKDFDCYGTEESPVIPHKDFIIGSDGKPITVDDLYRAAELDIKSVEELCDIRSRYGSLDGFLNLNLP